MKRQLKVLSIAYPFSRVTSDSAGGAEQILSTLDKVLAKKGHETVTIAAAGSETTGRLISADPLVSKDFSDEIRANVHKRYQELISKTLESESFDFIHMHGIDFSSYLPKTETPILVTLHLPPSWYPSKIFNSESNSFFLNAVSYTQRKECPHAPHLLGVIENGVPLEDFEMSALKEDYILCLGRICPEKGFHLALDIAKKADLPLILAGQVFPYPSHIHYFENEIAPRLDKKREYIGPVGLSKKRTLLNRARCLLVSSLAPETSCLVAMEALASGTPVVTLRTGALPEIIEDRVTGRIVDSPNEFAEAIESCSDIDPLRCIQSARNRFSADRMVESYLQFYDDVIEFCFTKRKKSRVFDCFG